MGDHERYSAHEKLYGYLNNHSGKLNALVARLENLENSVSLRVLQGVVGESEALSSRLDTLEKQRESCEAARDSREKELWDRLNRFDCRFEERVQRVVKEKYGLESFDEALGSPDPEGQLLAKGWTPSDPEQVQMNKQRSEKLHRDIREGTGFSYQYLSGQWSPDPDPERVAPKEKCFGDSFSRPSAPTVVSPEQVAPKPPPESPYTFFWDEAMRGYARPAPDTGPYEFCWKVCGEKDHGHILRSYTNIDVPVRYAKYKWALRPENCGPLTAFGSFHSLRGHYSDLNFPGRSIWLALGSRSKDKQLWCGDKPEPRWNLEECPEGTRLYDRIMLLQEVT